MARFLLATHEKNDMVVYVAKNILCHKYYHTTTNLLMVCWVFTWPRNMTYRKKQTVVNMVALLLSLSGHIFLHFQIKIKNQINHRVLARNVVTRRSNLLLAMVKLGWPREVRYGLMSTLNNFDFTQPHLIAKEKSTALLRVFIKLVTKVNVVSFQ